MKTKHSKGWMVKAGNGRSINFSQFVHSKVIAKAPMIFRFKKYAKQYQDKFDPKRTAKTKLVKVQLWTEDL